MNYLIILICTFTTLMGFTSTAHAQGQSYRNITVDGLSRRYLVYLPDDFDASENMPVMMWFHGGGGTASGGVFEADFRSLADTNRFIVVYAEAYPDVLENCRCWGYDSGDGETNGNYELDLNYSSAMIDDLVDTYNADRSRIYAGGYSMGGSFVWDLAKEKSDEFAALAPVASSMYAWSFDNLNSSQPTAICFILGTNDFYAPYNGASWVPSVASQNNFWVALNEAQTPPETVSIGGGVTRYTWAPDPNGSCHGYQHFRRQGGGHDVPGFAPSAIWDFVSQYDLDGAIEECGSQPIPGDLTGDDQVNGADLGLFLTRWGTNNADADINGNGTVEGADLGILLLNWTI